MKGWAKTMNKKKRVSVFDLVLLVLIAAGIAAGVFWFDRRTSQNTVELEYTVTFSEVEIAYAGCFSEGKGLYDREGVSMGTVVSSYGTASLIRTFDPTPKEEGAYSYRQSRSETLRDVTVTITVSAEKKPDGYYVGDTQIAAGLTLDLMTGGYAGSASVKQVSEVAE